MPKARTYRSALSQVARIQKDVDTTLQSNVVSYGNGESLLKTIDGRTTVLRSIKGGPGCSVSVEDNVVTITNDLNGESTTVTNEGTGEGIFAEQDGSIVKLKSINGGSGVNVSSDSANITIDVDSPELTEVGTGLSLISDGPGMVLKTLETGIAITTEMTGNVVNVNACPRYERYVSDMTGPGTNQSLLDPFDLSPGSNPSTSESNGPALLKITDGFLEANPGPGLSVNGVVRFRVTVSNTHAIDNSEFTVVGHTESGTAEINQSVPYEGFRIGSGVIAKNTFDPYPIILAESWISLAHGAKISVKLDMPYTSSSTTWIRSADVSFTAYCVM